MYRAFAQSSSEEVASFRRAARNNLPRRPLSPGLKMRKIQVAKLLSKRSTNMLQFSYFILRSSYFLLCQISSAARLTTSPPLPTPTAPSSHTSPARRASRAAPAASTRPRAGPAPRRPDSTDSSLLVGVNRDHVAVFQQRQRRRRPTLPARRGRRTRPRVPPEKRPSVIRPTLFAESLARQRRRHRQHLAHAGAADRAFAADDDDVARLDLRVRWMAAKHASSPSKTFAGPVMRRFLSPATLATAPSGARLPLRMTMCPVRVHRRVERLDDLLRPCVDARHVVRGFPRASCR